MITLNVRAPCFHAMPSDYESAVVYHLGLIGQFLYRGLLLLEADWVVTCLCLAILY
jgi:hypothetical protein